jgi:hypothetical protein
MTTHKAELGLKLRHLCKLSMTMRLIESYVHLLRRGHVDKVYLACAELGGRFAKATGLVQG